VSEYIDIRCPEDPRHLFLKLKSQGEATPVVEGNLLELACVVCRKTLRQRGEEVVYVFHRFNFLGELIETEVVRPEDIDVTRANPSP
jgi:hypothetical protein